MSCCTEVASATNPEQMALQVVQQEDGVDGAECGLSADPSLEHFNDSCSRLCQIMGGLYDLSTSSSQERCQMPDAEPDVLSYDLSAEAMHEPVNTDLGHRLYQVVGGYCELSSVAEDGPPR